MKALVLGATGQLGANLVRALLEKGYQVRAFKRKTSKTIGITRLPIETADGDLMDRDSILQALKGCQVLFHAGPYYPSRTVPVAQAVELGLTDVRNVMESAKTARLERVVYTSALTTIGPPSQAGMLANEECVFKTRFTKNPYLIAKSVMEEEVLRYAKDGLPVVIVNPTTLLGPYDSRPSSGTQILMIAKHLMPAYIEGLTNVIDVRDVASGMVLALEKGRVGKRYIMGNLNTSQSELSRMIARILNVSPPRIRMPFPVARWGSRFGEWGFSHILRKPPPIPAFFVEVIGQLQHYDSSKAIGELGLSQHPVENAILDAVKWFRENGYLKTSAS
jgi:dihydroflavonol-4-reductase